MRNNPEWRQGYSSYYDDLRLTDNPYSCDTQSDESAAWHQGWMIAQEDEILWLDLYE